MDEDRLARLAERTLTAEGFSGVEVSLSFVLPEEMADLHLRYMDESGPTDVLSFPLTEDGALAEDGLLGDVVVCPAEAARNRPEDVEAELRLLVVHGVLHLLGYDHEQEAERGAMWERQESYTGERP
ncbi:MAG: rRNA maturation RNase YbeY [Actinobacteria bacterium]|nr:rRNA maturation RNase YbeY [Actinomycetota bacterium]